VILVGAAMITSGAVTVLVPAHHRRVAISRYDLAGASLTLPSVIVILAALHDARAG
jgi:hypothetical protein